MASVIVRNGSWSMKARTWLGTTRGIWAPRSRREGTLAGKLANEGIELGAEQSVGFGCSWTRIRRSRIQLDADLRRPFDKESKETKLPGRTKLLTKANLGRKAQRTAPEHLGTQMR